MGAEGWKTATCSLCGTLRPVNLVKCCASCLAARAALSNANRGKRPRLPEGVAIRLVAGGEEKPFVGPYKSDHELPPAEDWPVELPAILEVTERLFWPAAAELAAWLHEHEGRAVGLVPGWEVGRAAQAS